MNKKFTIAAFLCLMLSTSKVHAEPLDFNVSCTHNTKLSQLIPTLRNLTAPNSFDAKSFENKVIQLVNAERAKAGVPVLKTNSQLGKTARTKAQDMATKNYFSHTSPTYGSPFKMMETFGVKFSSAGENIAKGQKTPEAVMKSWMNSPGHRNNILSPSYTQIGVGLAKNSNGTYYWTQMFIRPL